MITKQSILMVMFLLSKCIAEDYILEIDQGMLSGSAKYDRKGGIFYSFQSIPYAKPPIGELRFREPQPADNWDGILDATNDLPQCSQPGGSSTEDCLYLNIYTPQFPSSNYDTLKAVMVFIHGGAFNFGSGRQDMYSPEFLMPEDIVLVTINYRLGVFGALYLEDTSLGYPGNLQMKDQVMALKWIQSNIAKFGGNPGNVTIFGQSAGSASVHYHVLSPMSEGLFHKAIMESGTAIAPWAMGFPNSVELLAIALNISAEDTTEMFYKINDLSADEINEAQNLLIFEWGFLGAPLVEQKVDGQSAFLTDMPLSIIRSGNYNQVPIMIGYNNVDGLGFHWDYTEMFRLIPGDLEIVADSQEASEVIEKMYNFYYDSGFFEEPLIQLYTDVWFGYPAYRMANEHKKTTNNPIYFYRFSADTALNVYKNSNPINAQFVGADHTDEIGYLFNSTNYHQNVIIEPGSVEDEAIDRIVKLWTNFAKYGDPTPESLTNLIWSPVTEDAFNYVEFGSTETVPGIQPDPESIKFWSEIYDEYFTD